MYCDDIRVCITGRKVVWTTSRLTRNIRWFWSGTPQELRILSSSRQTSGSLTRIYLSINRYYKKSSFIAGNKIKKRWKQSGSKITSWHTNLKLRIWRPCFNRCHKTRMKRVMTRVRIKIQWIENSFHEKILNHSNILCLCMFELLPLICFLFWYC